MKPLFLPTLYAILYFLVYKSIKQPCGLVFMDIEYHVKDIKNSRSLKMYIVRTVCQKKKLCTEKNVKCDLHSRIPAIKSL